MTQRLPYHLSAEPGHHTLELGTAHPTVELDLPRMGRRGKLIAVRDREFADTKDIVSTPQVGFEPDEYYGPDRGFRSSTSRLQRCRTALSSRGHRGLVLALAEYGEREGEQEDQNCDHDRECHPLAHPNLL